MEWNGFVDLDAALEENVIIDNSNLTAEATVAAIQERLRSGQLAIS